MTQKQLAQLVMAQVINEHVIVELKNIFTELEYDIMGLVSDPYTARSFRLLDLFFAEGNIATLRCKLDDTSIDIPVSKMEYRIVKKMWDYLHQEK